MLTKITAKSNTSGDNTTTTPIRCHVVSVCGSGRLAQIALLKERDRVFRGLFTTAAEENKNNDDETAQQQQQKIDQLVEQFENLSQQIQNLES